MDWRWWTTPAEPRLWYLIYFAMVMFVYVSLASPLWMYGGFFGTVIGMVCCAIPSHWIVKIYMERDLD
ncbi:MAG: hypothetical protein AAGH70_13005 [Pseudomonadota bacterium]